MGLIVEESLALGFIPINTWQQRASLPFKPGVLERKVNHNDNITFISVLMFAKPSCDNVMQIMFGQQHIITLGLGKHLYTEKTVLSS